jgi:hypothetical protein
MPDWMRKIEVASGVVAHAEFTVTTCDSML